MTSTSPVASTPWSILPAEPLDNPGARSDVQVLGNWLFRDYVFAFEITGVLLTIAVVGAVMLARRPSGPLDPLPEDDALEVTS